jgi:D-sedoheptulose 7-phosphate isomerase
MKNILKAHLHKTTEAIKSLDQKSIKKAVDILREAGNHDSTVYLFGNGGSHANASHFSNDLFKAAGIKAICISEMVSTTLAYMNDISPDAMFSSILRDFAKNLDVIVAFSCSGDSQNVLNALLIAPPGVKKILLTGHRSGQATKQADVVIRVPSENIRIQESVHSAVCHAITEALVVRP